MSDQDPSQDPNDRSILDSGGSPNPEEPTDPAPSEPDADAPASESPAPEPPTDDDSADGADDHASDEESTDDLHFEDDHLGEKLRGASDEELDDAPFGIIKVDDEGTVEFFNQYEADLSGMDPDDVVGRNFFTQVAPCTNNRLFRGRFKKGVRRGDLDETFTYTYTYKMRPTLVDVHLFRDEKGNNWITVQKY
jgi:photoactive yellow protein